MQELEKIIEEINDWISDYEESNHFGDFDQFIRGLKRARILIRAHMTEELSRENATETTRTSRDNWIPVEERLPEVHGKYWATIRYDTGRISKPTVVDFRGVQQKYVVDTPNGREYETWGIDSAFYGSRVIAWRPYYIPDPYRPASN